MSRKVENRKRGKTIATVRADPPPTRLPFPFRRLRWRRARLVFMPRRTIA
jgi:hypothetical protein